MIFLKNNIVKIGIDPFGAELKKVFYKEFNKNIMWTGENEIWSGISPTLFPIVGKVRNDEYFFKGKKYLMPKHGFASTSYFSEKKDAKDDCSIEFILNYTEETLKIFPFKFLFTVKYTLNEGKVIVNYFVKNLEEQDIFFSIGGHPGFQIENFGKRNVEIKFEIKENLNCFYKINRYALLEEQKKVFTNGKISIDENIFENDAIILENLKSKTLSLNIFDNPELFLKFNFNNCDYLAFWAKPNSPYVCIEPWFGLNDLNDEKRDFDKKKGIKKLPAFGIFSYEYSFEIIKGKCDEVEK